MKTLHYLTPLILGILIGILLCRQCSRTPLRHSPARSDTTSTVGIDTGRGEHHTRPFSPYAELDTPLIPPPYIPKIIELITDTVIMEVDTAAIIADYLKSRIYKQTYHQDSMYTLEVTDTISANKLFGQGIKIEVYNKTITNTINNTHHQTGLLLGLAAHGPQFGVSGIVGWQFRGQTVVGGYDVVNRQGMLGVAWRVGR